MMAIEMTGGVYCPLSPRDPFDRINQLIEQTGVSLVLCHCLTKHKFTYKIVTNDIDSIMVNCYEEDRLQTHILSHITTAAESIAYILFTSGSTGIPKAVRMMR